VPLGHETSAFTGTILSPPMEFRDEPSLVLDNMEWHRGFLNDVFGEMASLDDLTCDIDMTEDPEWADRFMHEHLGGVTSASEPGPHKEITSQDNTGWLDQLSPNTLEYVLTGLGDLMPSPTNVIEQTGGDVIDNSMSPPTIPLNDTATTMQIVEPNVPGDIFDDSFIISELGPVQIGAGHENSVISPELREFYLLASALGHLQTYRVDFNPPEENVIDGGVILTDPVNVLHSYIDRIRALIEIQIQKWGSQGGEG
jgi:hypothetical protein